MARKTNGLGRDPVGKLLARLVLPVILAEPVTDITAATVTGIVFFTRFPRILRKRQEQLAADHSE